MKRFTVVAIFVMVFFGCGGDDEPKSEITLADLDKRLNDIEDEIDTLKQDVAQGNIKVIEGAIPIDPRNETEIIQDNTGGLPLSGEPVGGVPAVLGAGRIVFNLFGADDGIYVIGSNGAGKRLVVLQSDAIVTEPAISPDGEQIAYRFGHVVGNLHIHIRHIESGRDFRLTDEIHDNARYPSWSPDGERIAFSHDSDIYISSVDHATPQVFRITHDGISNDNPTWSPDGEQIAFSSLLDDNRNIFAIDVDGRNRIRLTNNPSDDEHPDWSPDGRHIAFMAHRHGTWDIYLVNTQTFAETQLTHNGDYRYPSFSPDGAQIAFSSTGDIYVMDTDGMDKTNITNSPDHEVYPDW